MHHDRDTLQKMHDDRYARTICTFWREPFSLFVIKKRVISQPRPYCQLNTSSHFQKAFQFGKDLADR
jgi:hypothetical protein